MFNLNMKELESYSLPNEIIEGEKLFKNNFFKTKNIEAIINSSKHDKMTYKTNWIESNYYYFTSRIEIVVDIDDQFLEMSCHCSCNLKRKACKHAIAFGHTINKYNDELKFNMGENGYAIYLSKLVENFEKARQVLIEKQRIAQINQEKKYFNSLLAEYNQTFIPTTLSEKVRIYPIYDTVEKSLSFKIGINFKYVVKNIRDFLNAVVNKEKVSYGKKLDFNHDIINFDSRSQKLIELLLSRFEYNDFYVYQRFNNDLRSIKINNYVLEEFLTLYINSYVGFNIFGYEKSIFVSDKLYKAVIYVDENGISLKVSDEYKLIICEHKNFIYIDKVIYELEPIDEDLKPIFKALTENQYISIEHSKDKFLKEIYPIIHSKVEVEDSFKEKYPLLDLRINSYFDYDNEVLIHYPKYFIGEEEVSMDAINKSKYTTSRLTLYNNYIKNLGFENGHTNNLDSLALFIRTDLAFLKTFGDIYLSENLKQMQVKKVNKINVSLNYDVDMFSVCFENLGFSDQELYKIISSFKKKKKFVRLKGDVIVEIDEKQMEELVEVIDDFNMDPKNLSLAQHKPLYTVAKAFNKMNSDTVEYNYNNQLLDLIKKIKDYKDNHYEVPDSFENVLRDYQVDAFKWLKTLAEVKMGGILADDMGLGKTIEVISFLVSDIIQKPSLIIVPTSLIYNWSNEIVKWGNELEHEIISGPILFREEIINNIDNSKKKLFITSYDTFKNDVELYKEKMFRFVILDEAQFIKNYYTQKAQAVKETNSEVRFVLTGTPIENSLLDLWSIFDFILPDYLSNHSNFRKKYEDAITSENNEDLLNVLVKKITPFVLRRTKKNVLKELPDKIENIVYVSMDEEQRKVYEAYLLSTRTELESGKSKFEMIARLTRLRQICVDPKMFLESYSGPSAKIDTAIDIITQLIDNNHRILLFSSFITLFPGIEAELERRNIKYFKLIGATPARARSEMADEFNKDENIKVFLISLKAGSTGLNLVGADTIIHFDPWWNVSVENQATDRTHRIGQKNTVQVIKLVCENSIEQKVIQLQDLKKDLADKIINDDETYLEKLGNDDLKYLLS